MAMIMAEECNHKSWQSKKSHKITVQTNLTIVKILKKMKSSKLFATLLMALLAAPVFAQNETKLNGTDLVGAWQLLSITERCPKNDSISHPTFPLTVVKFYKNMQMECSNPRDPFFGSYHKWNIADNGTTLAMMLNLAEGTSFQPAINADGDILFESNSYSEYCGMSPLTYIYRRADKIEKPAEPAAPAFVPDPNDPIFAESEVDTLPVFGRGESSLIRFLGMNIRYPAAAREGGIQGKAVVEFIVEKDGSLSNFKLLETVGGGCGEEALRVLKMMPKWIVGRKGGQPVRVRKTMPVVFKLE